MTVGVMLALGALFCWGFGDFFTQRSIRAVGIWKNIFFISTWGTILFFPLALEDLHLVFQGMNLLLILVLSIFGMLSAFINSRAFKIGKLSVIEPIMGLELPITVMLSTLFWKDVISGLQMIVILMIFFGVMMVATKNMKIFTNFRAIAEKGTFYAFLGSLGLAFGNFLIGVSSQTISPLATFWVTHAFFTIFSGFVLYRRGVIGELPQTFKLHRNLILLVMILNNFAWLFFSFSTTLIPISITTAISGSYIAIAVLLGIFINREKLKNHQRVGIAWVTVGVILLSLLT